ncbi:hypothetical protein J3D55_003944 [Chryseobacterium ginsenosidimutans]|nr:hypothetical protein [Chryseobacterium ginsenosidimutans]
MLRFSKHVLKKIGIIYKINDNKKTKPLSSERGLLFRVSFKKLFHRNLINKDISFSTGS